MGACLRRPRCLLHLVTGSPPPTHFAAGNQGRLVEEGTGGLPRRKAPCHTAGAAGADQSRSLAQLRSLPLPCWLLQSGGRQGQRSARTALTSAPCRHTCLMTSVCPACTVDPSWQEHQASFPGDGSQNNFPGRLSWPWNPVVFVRRLYTSMFGAAGSGQSSSEGKGKLQDAFRQVRAVGPQGGFGGQNGPPAPLWGEDIQVACVSPRPRGLVGSQSPRLDLQRPPKVQLSKSFDSVRAVCPATMKKSDSGNAKEEHEGISGGLPVCVTRVLFLTSLAHRKSCPDGCRLSKTGVTTCGYRRPRTPPHRRPQRNTRDPSSDTLIFWSRNWGLRAETGEPEARAGERQRGACGCRGHCVSLPGSSGLARPRGGAPGRGRHVRRYYFAPLARDPHGVGGARGCFCCC